MMLQPEQLSGNLRSSLLPLYWIAGDETLLVQESADLFRRECQQLGYDEREQFFAEAGFSWQSLQQAGSSMSLFSEKRILEVRMKSAKPGDEGNKALQAWLQSPNPDIVILLISPRLDASSTKTKWFQQIEKQSGILNIRNIDAGALPGWIRQRLGSHGLSADEQAVAMLAERVEGNLLAASQEIEKLAILHAGTEHSKLDADTINNSVGSSSRYNVFGMIDATLQGDSARALRMLNGMAAEGTEPLMILAMLCKEIRSLIQMSHTVAQGQSIHASMQAARVWSNRKACVQKALERLSPRELERILMRAKQVDHAVKGMNASNPWQELTDVVLLLSGKQTPATNYLLKTGS